MYAVVSLSLSTPIFSGRHATKRSLKFWRAGYLRMNPREEHPVNNRRPKRARWDTHPLRARQYAGTGTISRPGREMARLSYVSRRASPASSRRRETRKLSKGETDRAGAGGGRSTAVKRWDLVLKLEGMYNNKFQPRKRSKT